MVVGQRPIGNPTADRERCRFRAAEVRDSTLALRIARILVPTKWKWAVETVALWRKYRRATRE